MRYALAAGATVAIAVALVAPAISEGITESTTPNVTTSPCIAHPHPAHEQRRLERRSWAFSRWRDRTPAKGVEVARMRLLRSCANRSAIPAMRKGWRRAQRRFYRNRAYRLVTPYPGLPGEGYWLAHLAVPAYIVRCETRGYFGMARFGALNPSGAGGYAQAIPSTWQSYGGTGAPQDAPPLEQHQVFHRIWEGQGPGGWQCA